MARRGRPKKVKVEEPIEQVIDVQPEPVQEAEEPMIGIDGQPISKMENWAGPNTSDVVTGSLSNLETVKPEPEPQDLFTIDEAAHHFNVAERDIRLWVEHGILYGPLKHGSVRISRESMLRCRFSHMAIGPLM